MKANNEDKDKVANESESLRDMCRNTANNGLFTVCFEGKAIEPGKMPIRLLLGFLAGFNKVLRCSSQVVRGKKSPCPGRIPQIVTVELALNLVSLTRFGQTTILVFEKQSEQKFPEMDFTVAVLSKSLEHLVAAQNSGDFPVHDRSISMAWLDIGDLFQQGVDRIDFALQLSSLTARFTPDGFARIRAGLPKLC